MKKTLYSSTGLILIAVLFISFTLFNNVFFRGARIDLTENNLYTLSAGSINILNEIDEPINLYFFFSDKATQGVTSLRTYAQRVKEMLMEYASHADGKIKLNFIDPEPFSEEEEQASQLGLQGVSIQAGGEDIFFGLAATNSLDDQMVIPFFQPDKERLLEYDITKLVYRLSHPEKIKLGLVSNLSISGGFDMASRQPTPAWMIVEQIKQTFDLQVLSPELDKIASDIEVLMVVHPKDLSQKTLYAIDQFVLRGGRALVFVDPFAEQDQPQTPGAQQMQMGQQSSNLSTLFSAWGLKMQSGKVLGDARHALEVSAGAGQRPGKHLALLGLGRANISSDDVVTSSLESINVSSAGILEPLSDALTQFKPLIESSELAMPMDSMQFSFLRDISQLRNGFAPTGEKYVLAARISGPAKTAFPDGIELAADEESKAVQLQESINDINVVVVADTDVLSDRLWVRVQNFLGQRVSFPWADNASFVINTLDNLTGSSDLISVRSRGRYSRPFERINELKREAEAQFRLKEQELQKRLQETETELRNLQSSKEPSSLMALSSEQEAAVLQFQQQKLKIRRQLREVRHQLQKNIDGLGSWLKLLNVGLLPILLTLLLGLFVRARKKQIALQHAIQAGRASYGKQSDRGGKSA